jgi:hypothetical protein
MKSKTMNVMNDKRNPRKTRREPSHKSGFGVVCMDQIESLLPHQPGQHWNCNRILEGVKVLPELRNDMNRDSRFPHFVAQRSFGATQESDIVTTFDRSRSSSEAY